MFKGYNNTDLIAGKQNINKPRYVAYHHHTMYSNPTTIDCAISPKSFIQKSLDYGNMTVTCCEHGSPLSFYEYHSLLNYRKPKVKDGKPIEPDYRNTAKLVFATEAYFVIDNEVQFEKTYLDDLGNVKSSKTIKDNTNAHIILIAKTEKGRKDINYYGSLANEKGYYYKARWSLDYLLQLDPKDVMITTACFLEDTLVKTNNGLRYIKDVKSGDYVQTSDGEYNIVNYPTNRDYNGKLYSIKIERNNRIINCTEDHKFLIYDELQKNLIWKEAKYLNVNDFCVEPVNEIKYTNNNIIDLSFLSQYRYDSLNRINKYILPSNIILDYKDMMTFGLWIADGHISLEKNNYSVGFSFNENEFENYYKFIKHTMDKLNLNKPCIFHKENQHKIEINYNSKELWFLFKNLFEDNDKCDTKNIPKKLLHISKEYDIALLFGYLLGDGSFRYRKKYGGEYTSTTVSEKLNCQLRDLYLSLDVIPTQYIKEENIKDNIHRKKSYTLTCSNSILGKINKIDDFLYNFNIFKNNINKNKFKFIYNNNIKYLLKKINKISYKEYNGKVYCLNVNNNHSFIAEQVVVHNCIGGLWKYKTKFNPYKNNLERLSNFENNYNMINQNKTEELKNIAIELAFGGFEKYQEEKEFYNNNKNKIEEWSKEYDYLSLLKILHNHFGDSMYLEIQPHNTAKQKELNILIKELSKALGIKIIVGTDNHLNDEKGNIIRDNFLLSKNISYEDEDGWILGYSDYNTVVKQFLIQGIFTEEEIKEYLDNTLIIETFEEPFISDDIKLPVLPDLRNKSQEEKNKFFVDLIWDKWYNERKPQLKEINKKYFGVEEVIPFQKYEEDITKEIQVILDTNMADYFLLNYYVIKIGKEKYHGVLTKTGRGCFTPETKVFTTNGYKNIKDVQIGDIIINKNGEFDEVINTLQYDIEEDITEIDSYYNNPVKLTNDHRVYVYDTVKKEFLYKHAKDINSEIDRLCLKIKNLLKDNKEKIIDLYEYKDKYYADDNYIYMNLQGDNNLNEKDYVIKNFSIKELKENLNMSPVTISYYRNGKKKISQKSYDKIYNYTNMKPEEYDFYIKNILYTTKVNRYIDLDEDFAFFLGFLLGDGFIHKNKGYLIHLYLGTECKKDQIALPRLEKFLIKNNMIYSIKKSTNKNMLSIEIKNNAFAKMLLNKFNVYNNKIKYLNIQYLIENYNYEFCKALYEGLIYSDGSFLEYNQVSFDNKSPYLNVLFNMLSYYVDKKATSRYIDKRYDTMKTKTKNKYIEIIDNYITYKIKSINTIKNYKGKVYDLTIKNDPSFVVEGFIVHNSGGGFYLNNLLGFTSMDRFAEEIPLLSERFISTSRILESRTLPD